MKQAKEIKYRCSVCGDEFRRKSNAFTPTRSMLYKGNGGFLTICKTCVGEIYTKYLEKFDGDECKAIKRMCMLLDIYFCDSLFEASNNSNQLNRMNAYLSKINLVPYINKTFDDYLFSGVTAYPTEGTSGSHQTKDLYIALNSGSGDERFTDFTIKKDDFVNGYLLRARENQEIIFDESHIEYGENQSYSSLDVGTKLVATNSGKFKIESSVTNYGIYFEITEKLQFCGTAVSVKIVIN